MLTALLTIPLACVIGLQQEPQPPAAQRKVRIEVMTTENGATKRATKEFDATDDAQVQEALRELGVLDQMRLGPGERDITIDIRGFGDDGDAFLRMAPLPPLPPDAPFAFAGAPSAYLGVSTRNLASDDEKPRLVKQGAVVLEVVDDSPAAKLGLKEGDIITEVDGKAVDGPVALAERVRARKPGDAVDLVWLRDGKTMKGKAVLGERQAHGYSFRFDERDLEGQSDAEMPEGLGGWKAERKAFLGVTPGDEDGAGQGALIGTVEPGSAAEQMGIQPGDRITAVNGAPVQDFAALAERIRGMKPGDNASLALVRDGAELRLEGALGERKAHRYLMPPPEMHRFGMDGFNPDDREAMRRELDQLRREMDELRRDLGKDIRREVRVRMQARELNAEEKALLRGKGVAVDKELTLEGLNVFPNPSNGFFRLQFDMPERGDLAVDVHNANGERVYQERIVGFKGRYERTLDLSDQASGSYYLVISQGGRAATSKLVKE